MIVKVVGTPVQVTPLFVYVGVTVIVAVFGMVVVLRAVNGGKSPVPESPKPIELLELLHEYSVVPPVFRVENT